MTAGSQAPPKRAFSETGPLPEPRDPYPYLIHDFLPPSLGGGLPDRGTAGCRTAARRRRTTAGPVMNDLGEVAESMLSEFEQLQLLALQITLAALPRYGRNQGRAMRRECGALVRN